MSKPMKPAREFRLKQFSMDGGIYSDIRVLKISEGGLAGHDSLNFNEITHVIECSAIQALTERAEKAERKAHQALTYGLTYGDLVNEEFQEPQPTYDDLKSQLAAKDEDIKNLSTSNNWYIENKSNQDSAITKLRSALEKTEHGQQGAFSSDDTYEAWQKCRTIARQALKETSGV